VAVGSIAKHNGQEVEAGQKVALKIKGQTGATPEPAPS
jgi:hypothetical protein